MWWITLLSQSLYGDSKQIMRLYISIHWVRHFAIVILNWNIKIRHFVYYHYIVHYIVIVWKNRK